MVHQIICDNNFVLPDLQMIKLLALYFNSIWKKNHFFNVIILVNYNAFLNMWF